MKSCSCIRGVPTPPFEANGQRGLPSAQLFKVLGTVAQRPEHMLKYCTGLQLVGFGQAFPDRSNHFAHERIVFQTHSPRNGLFKREPDIVGTNASCDRHEGLRTLLGYLANGL
jgi:hypothetical protein